jgi:hypothetical protein
MIDLDDIWHHPALERLPDQGHGEPVASASVPKAIRRQLAAWTRAVPMRSSQS